MVLSHLERLHDTLEPTDGDPIHVWWIYARPAIDHDGRPPSDAEYVPFHASAEGVACVDDVARIAVAYANHHDVEGDEHSRTRTRQALEFVRYMQADDGRFLNFVTDPSMNERIFGEPDPDLVDGIVVDGSPTSERSLGFWASRACWAHGQGYGLFADADPAFAGDVAGSLRSYVDALVDGPLSEYGEYEGDSGREVPSWLVQGDSYATAPTVLGLASYCRARDGDGPADGLDVDRAKAALEKLAEGLLECSAGGAIDYPFGAHLSIEPGTTWHTWGIRQAAALARAGDVLDEDDYLSSARREVASLHTLHAVSDGQIGSFGPTPLPYHQLSYGTDALVQGCTELWRATGEVAFARLGAQIASWYAGNNLEAVRMCDPEAGRGYDGLYSDTIDWKSGAESTVAAVRTALDLRRYPDSAGLNGEADPHDARAPVLIDAAGATTVEKGTRLYVEGLDAVLSGGRVLQLFDGGTARFEPGPPPGSYRPYLVLQRTIAPVSTAILTVGDDRRTVEFGGASDAHFSMFALDPVEVSLGDRIRVEYEGARDREAKLDAAFFVPAVSWRIVTTEDQETSVATARSVVDEQRTVHVPVPTLRPRSLETQSFDDRGRLVEAETDLASPGAEVPVSVEPRGFSLLRATVASGGADD